MAKNEFNLESWLDNLGVASDKRASVLEALKPLETKLKGEVLAQSDYSRNMDQLRTEREEVAASKQAAEEYKQRLEEWRKTYVEEQQPALVAQLQQAALENAHLKSTMQYRLGVDPNTLRTPWSQPNNQPTSGYDQFGQPIQQPNQFNQPGFGQPPAQPARPAQFNQQPPYPGSQVQPLNPAAQPKDAITLAQVTDMMGGVAGLNAALFDLANEHARLFNGDATAQPFRAQEFLNGYAEAAAKQPGLTPQQHWESAYKVNEKRQALLEADIQTRINQAREEGRREARNQALVPDATKAAPEGLSPFMRGLLGQQGQAPQAPAAPTAPNGQSVAQPAQPQLPQPGLDNTMAAEAQAEQTYWSNVLNSYENFKENPDKAREVLRQYSI